MILDTTKRVVCIHITNVLKYISTREKYHFARNLMGVLMNHEGYQGWIKDLSYLISVDCIRSCMKAIMALNEDHHGLE